MTTKKELQDYWVLKRYDELVVENKSKFIYPVKEGVGAIQFYVSDVMVVENKSKLIYPVKEGVSAIQFYVSASKLFDVLHDAHLAIGHGGRDRMLIFTQTHEHYSS